MEPLKHQHSTCMEDSGICFFFPFKNISNTLPCPHLNEYSSYLSNPFPTTQLIQSLFGGWCILCEEKPANKIQLAKPKQKSHLLRDSVGWGKIESLFTPHLCFFPLQVSRFHTKPFNVWCTFHRFCSVHPPGESFVLNRMLNTGLERGWGRDRKPK